jgi:hypothetical protein
MYARRRGCPEGIGERNETIARLECRVNLSGGAVCPAIT